MRGSLVQRVLTASVIVASVMLGMTSTANAVRSTPPEAAKSTAPVTLSMQQLNQRVGTLSELAMLKQGDTLTLFDDGSVTDSIWQGKYAFYPAGSVVPRAAMYARWKDGIVTLTPNISGTLDAHFVQQTYQLDKRPAIVDDPGILSPAREEQTTKTLITEPTARDILRIPDNAYLFRVDRNGQLTALVDVFVYQSGATPVPHKDWLPGQIPTGNGSQPVPVSAQPLKR